MTLSIDDQETRKMADDLARLTGETVTAAIAVAVRERLERERDIQVRAQELHIIAQRCAKLMGEGPSSVDRGDLLYDERGLPR